MGDSQSSSETPLVLYDIAMRPPREQNTSAPNPWKARLALNFKAAPYSTQWVPLPNVSKVRSGLGVPAGRKFADGTDFHTLPLLHDQSTSQIIGDSFDIAVYLQDKYPESGAGDLFPPQELDFAYTANEALLVPLSENSKKGHVNYAEFNRNVDAAFTTHTLLMLQGMPLDPSTAEATKAEFCRRAGVDSWDAFSLVGEARQGVLASFEATLSGLAKLFNKDPSGPFILGNKPSYADLIVGGWLRMANKDLPDDEWQALRSWQQGTWGRLHDALEIYAQVK